MATKVESSTSVKSNSEEETEAKIIDEIDEKRCHICGEVMINACRISCGHLFCRRCIDRQLDPPDNTEKIETCVICNAKISEIQNCPEIDKEIDKLFSSMSINERLEREGIKSDRRHEIEEDQKIRSERQLSHTNCGDGKQQTSTSGCNNSNENQPSANTGGSSSYPDNNEAFNTPASGQYFTYPDQIRSETEEEDEGPENSDGSFLVHETITFHRTMRVSNPQTNSINQDSDDYDETQSDTQQQFYSHTTQQPGPQQRYHYDQREINFDPAYDHASSFQYHPYPQYASYTPHHQCQNAYSHYHNHNPLNANNDPNIQYPYSYSYSYNNATHPGNPIQGDHRINNSPVSPGYDNMSNAYYSSPRYYQNDENDQLQYEDHNEESHPDENDDDECSPAVFLNLNFDLVAVNSHENFVEANPSDSDEQSSDNLVENHQDHFHSQHHHHLTEECQYTYTDDDIQHYYPTDHAADCTNCCFHSLSNLISNGLGAPDCYRDETDSEGDQ